MTEAITKKKTPTGTMDIASDLYNLYEEYKTYLENLFKQYGGKGLDTPVFEIRENLLNKYGDEAEKLLVFNLQDHGGDSHEKYTLRYDLTIPKIRHVVQNNIVKDRIYSIGKVYRRDHPSSGRFREFYQADFDIIGESNSTMVNEFMLFKMVIEFMNKINSEYTIHINFTQNLYHIIVELLGIDITMFKKICTVIDKLDKNKFEDVVSELKNNRLDNDKIEQLRLYLEEKTPRDTHSIAMYDKLVGLLSISECESKEASRKNNIIFTPTLARGLDYYNGIIFEVKAKNNNLTIISGGRYDNLIPNTTLIGLSFGLSRIIDIMKITTENKWKDLYYLATLKGIGFDDKIKIWNNLENKFKRRIMISDEETDKKLIKIITHCITNNIKYLYIIGPDELKENKVILKDLENKTQELICL